MKNLPGLKAGQRGSEMNFITEDIGPLYHGSHDIVTEITTDGIFGGIFAAGLQVARSHGDVIHRIISPRPLTNAIIYMEDYGLEALELADGDVELADAILDPGCPAPEFLIEEIGCHAEADWYVQALRGTLARLLGYTSVQMYDEHGTTWLCLPGCEVRLLEVAEVAV